MNAEIDSKCSNKGCPMSEKCGRFTKRKKDAKYYIPADINKCVLYMEK